MMLLTVCASGTNSIFATENVEKNEIEVYEISPESVKLKASQFFKSLYF